MSIEAIGAVAGVLTNAAPVAQISAVTPSIASGATQAPGAFDSLLNGLQNLNMQMTTNQQAVESLAVGDTNDLHRVIMNLESTKLSFDLMLQVRNKVLDAYQELMRMQI